MHQVALTLAEAAAVLEPPVTEYQLRHIIHQLPGITPAGARRQGRPGRPELTYRAADLMRLHAALVPWLAAPARDHVA